MTTPSDAVEIYCVKCKAKTASKDIEAVTMKNGRPATRGPAARLPMANGPVTAPVSAFQPPVACGRRSPGPWHQPKTPVRVHRRREEHPPR